MNKHVIIYGENIYDVCIAVYGNLEALPTLMKDNPILTSWSMDLAPLAGQVLLYDESLYNTLPAQVNATAKISSTIKYYTGQNRQSIYDVLMLTYGSFDNLLKLVQENGASLLELNANMKSFTFDSKLTQNQNLFIYLNNLAPAKPATLYLERQGFRVVNTRGYRLLNTGGRRKIRS